MTKNLCTLYLIRHGQTEWNAIGRIQGQKDSKLSEIGISQAHDAKESLKNIQFDKIFSSDLIRTQQTAEIINLERKLTITTHEALRERSLGEHDGKMGKDYEEEIRHLLDEYKSMPEEGKWNFKFGKNYESDSEVLERFIRILREISVAYLGKNILVVTHGGAIRILLTKLGYAKYGELTPGTFKNAGYVVLESDGVDFFIKEVHGIVKDPHGRFTL